MAKKSVTAFVEDFAFHEQLWYYYETNRGKIRSRSSISLLEISLKGCYTLARIGSRSCLTSKLHSA